MTHFLHEGKLQDAKEEEVYISLHQRGEKRAEEACSLAIITTVLLIHPMVSIRAMLPSSCYNYRRKLLFVLLE